MGTKRNTLMSSAWCRSKLLTADCFCVELCGDAEFKLWLMGRLWPNYGTLRLCAWNSARFSPAVQLLQNIITLILQCKICIYLCVFPCNCQHFSAQQQMFLVTTKSTAIFQCCCCDHKLCWCIVLAVSF